jgi:hypothetical protein
VYIYGQGFVAPLPAGRAFSSAVALGGYIYLAGGDTEAGIDAKTYRYDPVSNVWEDAPIADMFTARSWAVSGFLNGRWVLASGAFGSYRSTIGWDPQTNSWHTITPLGRAVDNGGGAVAGGSLYAISALNGIVQQYDPSGCATATPTLTMTASQTGTASGTPTGTVIPSFTATSAAASATPSVSPTPCTLMFSDVPVGSTFYRYIRCLACLGIVSGYEDGTFRPNRVITRGQIAKIVSVAAGFSSPNPPDRQTFEDVVPGSTFWLWVERMHADSGLMEGYTCGGPGEPCVPPGNRNYFRPYNKASRAQIMKVAVGAAVLVLGWRLITPPVNTFEDVQPSSDFYSYIETAYSHGVINGYPCGGPGIPCIAPGNKPYFRSNNSTTRGQASKIIANTFFPDCNPPARLRRP